jgi:dCTP deaminase
MIVKDTELKALIQRQFNPLLTGFDPQTNWDGKDSLVQPSSIDLHIGDIYEPGIKPGNRGSADHPKKELILKTGRTAIVTTQEAIHLPDDYAGFGFPPSHVSALALLMTNPGHIDPGYSGKLQFTVINMGREDYILRRRDIIVTVLILKLSAAVGTDYAARHPASASARATASRIEQNNIDRLSPDFVDVSKRAKSIAQKTLGYATVGATVLAILVGWLFNAIDKRMEGIDQIQSNLLKLEDSNKSLTDELHLTKEQLEKQLDLDRRLSAIEQEKRAPESRK